MTEKHNPRVVVVSQLSEQEMRVIGLVYGAGLIGLMLFNIITMRSRLSLQALLAYVVLALSLAILYALSMPWTVDAIARRGLRALFTIFSIPVLVVFAIALLLKGRADLYFYLLTFDGYTALTYFTGKRYWGMVYVGGLMALAGLSHALVANWQEAGAALWDALPWFVLTTALSEIMTRQWEQRNRVEALLSELEQAHQQLQDYTSQAESLAIARERARLAHEIHDSVGHTLTALTVQLGLLTRLSHERTAERQRIAEQALALAEQGLTDTRRAVQALRPEVLEVFSLPEAIAELIERFQQTAHLEIAWQIAGIIRPLSPHRSLLLYRTTQEALTNVCRHAPAARHVTVHLCYTDEAVSLEVENDGLPLHPTPEAEEISGGYGLRGLQERAEALGGILRAGPDDDGLFRVKIALPTIS
ncbi:MAG: sensor histidine kinase [Anaerolineae bacterium]|nr:sensor histidine kinase [Anaerolineae bacterium]